MSVYVCPIEKSESLDASYRTEDKRVKNAVALYKKELNKRDSNAKKDSKSKNASVTT